MGKKIYIKVSNKDGGHIKKAKVNQEAPEEIDDISIHIKYEQLKYNENLLEMEI